MLWENISSCRCSDIKDFKFKHFLPFGVGSYYSPCAVSEFFEDLAAEAKLSADQPIIMKNAVCARKTMARRAKTMKFTNRKRSSSKYVYNEVNRTAVLMQCSSCFIYLKCNSDFRFVYIYIFLYHM